MSNSFEQQLEVYFRSQGIAYETQEEFDIAINDLKKYVSESKGLNFLTLRLVLDNPANFAEQLTMNGAQIRLEDYQRMTLESLMDQQDVVILSSRQMGITTMLSIYALWLATFNNDNRVVFLVPNRSAIQSVLRLIKEFHKGASFIPPAIKRIISMDRASEIQFSNNSSIHINLPDNGHYGNPMHLLVDNMGQMGFDQDDGIYSDILNAREQVVIAGTPSISKGLLYDIVQSPLIVSKKILLPYDVNPAFDESWAKRMKRSIGAKMFNSEYNLQFRSVD